MKNDEEVVCRRRSTCDIYTHKINCFNYGFIISPTRGDALLKLTPTKYLLYSSASGAIKIYPVYPGYDTYSPYDHIDHPADHPYENIQYPEYSENGITYRYDNRVLPCRTISDVPLTSTRRFYTIELKDGRNVFDVVKDKEENRKYRDMLVYKTYPDNEENLIDDSYWCPKCYYEHPTIPTWKFGIFYDFPEYKDKLNTKPTTKKVNKSKK